MTSARLVGISLLAITASSATFAHDPVFQYTPVPATLGDPAHRVTADEASPSDIQGIIAFMF